MDDDDDEPPYIPEPELAFPGASAAEVADAVRGILLRDFALAGLRAHAALQLPEPEAPPAGGPARPPELRTLAHARALAGLGLALKRLADGAVAGAPESTLMPALLTEMDRLFSRAVRVERTGRPGVQRSLKEAYEDGDRAMHEFERKIAPYEPDLWSNAARAEVGMSPARPEDRIEAERAHAVRSIAGFRLDLARLDAREAALTGQPADPQKLREIEVRIAAELMEGRHGDDDDPPSIGRPRPG